MVCGAVSLLRGSALRRRDLDHSAPSYRWSSTDLNTGTNDNAPTCVRACRKVTRKLRGRCPVIEETNVASVRNLWCDCCAGCCGAVEHVSRQGYFLGPRIEDTVSLDIDLNNREIACIHILQNGLVK